MFRSCGLALAALATLACGTLHSSGPEPVAARVGDTVISVADVDASIAQQLYELREGALDDLITRRALELRAAEEGVGVDELVERATGGVSDQEIAEFFATREEVIRAQIPDATLESVSPQIRALLERQHESEFVREVVEATPVEIALEAPRIEVQVEGSPSLGPVDAPVTLVEFSDFQCPYCRRSSPVMKALTEKYPDELRIVYRHLPLPSHARARPAAEASACAGEQGSFWEYHDLIFGNPQALADGDLHRYAADLDLDAEAFGECFRSRRYARQVSEDARAARAAGITGTPGFVLNGRVITGYKSVEAFEKLIEQELDRAVAEDEAG